MVRRRESGEGAEPPYTATIDPADVNPFTVRKSRDHWGGHHRTNDGWSPPRQAVSVGHASET